VRGRTAAFLCTVALALASSAGAQPSVVVRDPDGVPVPRAQVQVARSAPIPTDASGRIPTKEPLAAGTTLRVRRIGFAPLDTTLRIEGGVELLLVLRPLAVRLGEVAVIESVDTPLARTGFYDRMRRVRLGAIRGEFVPPEELEARSGGLLASLFHGRQLVSVGRGRPLMLTGRGGCQASVLLDGRVVDDEFIDDLVGANEIMGIEIYGSTANAPAELIPLTRRGSCALVAIWTGPRR
jgi:hypothetical protein